MLSKILLSLAVTPVIYLVIALTLVLIPVQRNNAASTNNSNVDGTAKSTEGPGLDFGVLAKHSRPAGQEKFYSARDGSPLFYRYFDAHSDTTLILLHGSGTDGRYLSSLASVLQQQAHINVAIADLRGHGRSMLSSPGDIGYYGQFDHDLIDLNSHLRSATAANRLLLGGHSSGGGLAIRLGGNPAADFAGYLLLSPYLGYQAPTVRENSGGWVQVAARRYAGLAMLNNVGISALNASPVLFFNRPIQWRGPLQVDSYSYRLNQSFAPADYAQQLQDNNQPILLVVGANDEAFYAEQFAPLFKRYAPQAQVEIIDDSKHLDIADNTASQARILSWLVTTYALPHSTPNTPLTQPTGG